MNIFYLDYDPKLCAQYHTDKHVVKMILESAQLLCTALNVTAGEQVTPYKTTHVNHPCSIWVRESYNNWNYVFNLMIFLEAEWNYRWEHDNSHLAVQKLQTFGEGSGYITNIANSLLPHEGFTTPALVMPEHCKVAFDPVESYRNYYIEEKKHLHKWTKRGKPDWL